MLGGRAQLTASLTLYLKFYVCAGMHVFFTPLCHYDTKVDFRPQARGITSHNNTFRSSQYRVAKAWRRRQRQARRSTATWPANSKRHWTSTSAERKAATSTSPPRWRIWKRRSPKLPTSLRAPERRPLRRIRRRRPLLPPGRPSFARPSRAAPRRRPVSHPPTTIARRTTARCSTASTAAPPTPSTGSSRWSRSHGSSARPRSPISCSARTSGRSARSTSCSPAPN